MTAEMTPIPDQPRLAVAANLAFEIVPLKSVEAAIDALPPASTVTVTCSPTKGIATTQELTDRVRAAGHTAIPHLAARMVSSPQQVIEIARWLRTEGIRSAFVVGGDSEPLGPYTDGHGLLRDLLAADPGLGSVGVPSYPDDHPLIPRSALDDALAAKQALLTGAGLGGWTSTQMCFDPAKVVGWAEGMRQRGLTLPIHLGLPGVVERSKLVSLGMRLGVGASIRYLRKNRRAVGRLLSQADYDPDDLFGPLTPDLDRLGITGIHCFTFNQVAATAQWRAAVLREGKQTA